MDGILVGGYYTGNTERVPVFLYSLKLRKYNYYDDFCLYEKHDHRPITKMLRVAPEQLVSWSE